MTTLPEDLLQSLVQVPGFDREQFLRAHAQDAHVFSVRMNPAKPDADTGLPLAGRIPWSSEGYYLSNRPAFIFDPLLHAGVYYVQEASSMFLEQAIRQTTDLAQPLRVLDLCAAPGGKSTLLQSLISKDSLLVSNEVIKSRASILEENLVKWGALNAVVTSNDAANFARMGAFFDIVVADAPCSGSGLFRKEPAAINEWSEGNVALCSQRQQRILSDIWPAIKPGGLLIYSTCSYSPEENEAILDWLANDFQAEGVALHTDKAWGVVPTVSPSHGMPGYRFYPDKVKGEGFFLAVVRKTDTDTGYPAKHAVKATAKADKAKHEWLQTWVRAGEDLACIAQGEEWLLFPQMLLPDLRMLQSVCYIKKAGVVAGKPVGKELIPDHQLALSGLCNAGIPSVELALAEALQYLRRDELQLVTQQTGWQLVTYKQHPLGWIKALPRRINNYYPKEWRILKQPL